ncbi:MAG: hypothetical protein V4587_00305 [Acidobacteriota bacterium]
MVKQMPEPTGWQADGDQFNALVEDMREHGLRKPLLIDDEGHLLSLDDRARHRAARQLQLAEVPVSVIATDSVFAAMISSVLHRKHLSKSARAYILYPLFEKAHQEAARRYTENLKKGQQISVLHAVQDGKDGVSKLASRAGISDRLFRYAAEVHDIFRKDAEYKANLEEAILSDDPEECVALSRVVAGYGGRNATAGKNKGGREQLSLFEDVLDHQFNRFKYWGELADADRKKAWAYFDRRAQQLTEEELDSLASMHEAMAERARNLKASK